MHFFYGDFMRLVIDELLKVAREASDSGEIPVAAAIVDSEMNIISIMGNNRQSKYDVLGHAEILSIQEAGKFLKDWRLNGYSMVVTLEPCLMCDMVINESRLDKVYYLANKDDVKRERYLFQNYELITGFEREKNVYNELLSNFFINMR